MYMMQQKMDNVQSSVSENWRRKQGSSVKRKRNYRDFSDSLLKAEHSLSSLVQDRFLKLRRTWDAVGMSEEQRGDRVQTVHMHLEHLLDEMVNEEEEMLDNLKTTIDRYLKRIKALSRQLKTEDFRVPIEINLLEREKLLHEHLDYLLAEKSRRVGRYRQLKEQYDSICRRLRQKIDPTLERSFEYLELLCQNDTKETLDNDEDGDDGLLDEKYQFEIPSEGELDKLEKAVVENKVKMDANIVKLTELKREIYRLMTKLNYTPKTDLEKAILSEPLESLPLSDEFLSDLKILKIRLTENYALYLASIRSRVREMETRLLLWWEKCRVGEIERQNFERVTEENFDENALKRYEDEISKWTEYYEERQEILDKVQIWIDLWARKIGYEEKDKDANRLLNRGGALLQEEKERKMIDKRLPLVKKEIKGLVDRWTRDPVCVDDIPVLQHLERIEEEYYEKKEQEKLAKQAAKKQQVVAERIYGISPATPKKRPIAALSASRRTPKEKETSHAARTYVHSSLAMTRSPTAFGAGPSGSQNSVKSRPPGLPMAAGSSNNNSLKRKALAPANDERAVLVSNHDGNYQKFVTECKLKGNEAQSSFIQHAHINPDSIVNSPSKILRRS